MAGTPFWSNVRSVATVVIVNIQFNQMTDHVQSSNLTDDSTARSTFRLANVFKIAVAASNCCPLEIPSVSGTRVRSKYST